MEIFTTENKHLFLFIFQRILLLQFLFPKKDDLADAVHSVEL